MARFVPNATLPPGAVLIEPVAMKIGGYVKLEYDAKLEYRGITLFRVRDGFGQGERNSNPREDWVCEIAPGIGFAVCDYHWNAHIWPESGSYIGTFLQATDSKIVHALECAVEKVSELEREAATLRESIAVFKHKLQPAG